MISLLSVDKLGAALENIKGGHVREGRALLILLYYTGARPNEILRLKGKDISKEGTYIKITLPGSKNGLTRAAHIPKARKFMTEAYNYAKSLFPDVLLFFHYRSNCARQRITKKGKVITYEETTRKTAYYINKWFEGVVDGSINQYFLRHNRFSQMMENDATPEEVRQLKGAKTYDSVTPYTHMSSKSSKRAGRRIK